MDKCAHIIVSGVVQGVGFRYFVIKLARRLVLNGWVRNMPSSEVEIEVEGPEGMIQEMIRNLWTGNPYASVNNVNVHWDSFKGKYTGFDITY